MTDIQGTSQRCDRIIDAHTHFSGSLYPTSTEERKIWHGADELIQSMDQWGIDVSIVSSIEPMQWFRWNGSVGHGGKTSEYGGNERVAEAMQQFPNRIVGSYVPNTFAPAKRIKRNVRLFCGDYGFRQIKLHPWLGGFPANATELIPVFEAASDLGIPVLFHSGTIPYTTPAQIFDMAQQFPDVRVIMGHAGKGDLCYDALALARYADNLYMDTSGQPNKVFIELCVATLGSERLLYASDWLGSLGKLPFRRLEVEVLDVSKADKENMMYKNAERLFCLKQETR